MISNKCKYAIRAVLFLSLKSTNDKKINIFDIGKKLKIPIPYLGKILQELVRKQVISSVKGPNGGFYLTDRNNSEPLINIISAIDGTSSLTGCGLGLENCSEKCPCPIHEEYHQTRKKLNHIFRKQTIKEISKNIKKNDLFLVR